MARQVDEGRYPAHREADVVLRDGSTVHLRPVRPEDEAALLTFFRALSEQARALRFFTRTSDEALGPLVHRMVHVDYVRRYGIVATVGVPERIIGHAMYAALDGDRAEVAFAVADDYQGRGLGTLMLGHLAEHAAEHRIRLFEAEVLPTNIRMLDVFRDAGFPTEVQIVAGEVHERFPTTLTPEALAKFEEREMVAAANALRTFFAPRAVAVVGASRQRGTIGGELFHNLLAYGFAGPVYPVNPRASVVQSVVAYPSVEAIPGPVDLAVIVTPAEHVVEAAQACARKGVRALVVISAGFGETGDAGRARQAELLRVCRASGMRLIGPNCMGIINTDPAVRLNATFAPVDPPEGRIGFMSQSGALGLAILDYARMLGLGISTFVSVGNKADISGNDLLAYWEQDPRTDVILLYLESFGNPQKFSRLARRVGRRKPIVAVKSGRTRAGARATSSHTGALLAASDITVDALFRQAGVIRTDTLEEMFDVAALLAHQPVPAGRRVGIVSVHVHPRYDPMAGRFDIAALGLAEEAVDTPRRVVRPEPTTMSVTAYGWGSTAAGRPGSCRLERIPLRAAPGEGCPGLDATGPRRFDAGSMLCVLPEGTSTTCFGDSGGPVLVGDDRDRRAPVVAIVSWASRCGEPGADALASLWPF